MFTPPPRYALAVLAELTRLAGPDRLAPVEVTDAAMAAATGYSLRSVQLAYQRIVDADAANVSRHGPTGRLVFLDPAHAWVRIASTVAEVAS